MRPILSTVCAALTAAGLATGMEFVVTFNTAAAQPKVIPVLVGGSSLTYTPNNIVANPGDVIQFQFAARNHTVTQSAQSSPCRPVTGANGSSSSGAAGAAAPGVNSGFVPFDGGTSGMVGTFDMPVTSTQPMFFYCAQATHCQLGMVMVVNAQNPTDLINYANAAAAASSSVPAKQVAGGALANIPLADAVLPQAANGTPPGVSMGPTITIGGTATAVTTITVPPPPPSTPPQQVGDGTATEVTTVVVPAPSPPGPPA